MNDIDRRKLLKAGVWAVPVVAVAVSTPLAAASTAPDCIRIKFTNLTATVGKKANTLYVNTKVQVIDGPDPVKNMVLVISPSRDGATLTKTWPIINGWGNTEQVYREFVGVPKGEPVTVSFAAFADGVTLISGSVQVETPGGWA